MTCVVTSLIERFAMPDQQTAYGRHSLSEQTRFPGKRAGAARGHKPKNLRPRYGAAGELPGSRARLFDGRHNLVVMRKTTPLAFRRKSYASSARSSRSGENRRTGGTLKKLASRPVDILDIGQDFGEFDYQHQPRPVFSWVPTRCRTDVRDLPAQSSPPRPVAIHSTTLYPGWAIRGIRRDMML